MFCGPTILRLLNCITETIQVTKGRMLASTGLECAAGMEVEHSGLILNSVSGRLYYDETW